jgi:hypothetical protein
MGKAQLGAGNVEIELDGEIRILKPSLQAAQAISRQKGGIMAAIRSAGDFDFDTIVNVIALGLGVSGKEARDLPEQVYSTGLPDLSGPVIRYLSIIANGGRPLDDGGEGDQDPQTGQS